MSKPHGLVILALFASACQHGSALSRGDADAQTAGTDGGAGVNGGTAGGTAGANGGTAGANGGAAGANAGTGGANAGTGGTNAGTAGGAGGSSGGGVPPVTACFTVDTTASVSTPCPVTCGNGTIDHCSYVSLCPGSGAMCPTVTFTEVCDGDALGTSSCASLGYAGGTLRCGAWCGFDTRGCDACEHGAGIAGCVSAVPEVVAATELALATTDTEIAIAWLDGDSQATRTGLRFARFRPDLSRLSLSECFGPDAPTQVALAATPTGWLVATTTADGLHVFPLSPTGAPAGAERVIAGAQDPLLVARPTGGPLLYWTDGTQTFAELARADGSAETPPVMVFPYAINTSAGVFTGDGFLLASQLAQIWTTRIGTDGRVAAQTTLQSTLKPVGYAPGLAWNGTDAAITYYAGNDRVFGPSSIAWARVDRTGASLAPATVVGGSQMDTVSSQVSGVQIASVGAQTIVLSGPTQTSLQVGKVDGTGTPAGASFGLTRDPAVVRTYWLGKAGPEVIAAWTTDGSYRDRNSIPGRIGLARLTP